jgi:hypothetical protein
MNDFNPWLFLVPVAGLLTLVMLWWFYGIGREIQAERVRESFRLQHERLEKLFFEKASSTGLPRGLRWRSCVFSPDALFGRDKASRQIVALVPVVIQFEAVEGGDMEGLPAVPVPRQGCAVLHFVRGEWSTTGRVIYNLEPAQVLEQFDGDFTVLAAKSTNNPR